MYGMQDRTRSAIGAGALSLLGLLAVTATTVQGHVRYVTEGEGEPIPMVTFFGTVVGEPVNAALLVGGGLFAVGSVVGYWLFRPLERDVIAVRRTLQEYTDLVPWLLRLSLGLPMVGAGFAGYFFSPAVPATFRLFQIAVGFLLLFGFATRLAAAVGLIAYLIGFAFVPDLMLASEYVGGFLATMILGGGRPSADQLLQQVALIEETRYSRFAPVHRTRDWLNRNAEPYKRFAPTAVRVGLGINFIYLGFAEKIANPGRALLVVEKYDLTSVVPVDPGLWVVGVGLTEIAIGAALVIGLFTRGVAVVAFVIFTVTLFSIPDEPVLAHVTLFGMVSMLLITGSGRLSVDNLLGAETPDVETSVEGK